MWLRRWILEIKGLFKNISHREKMLLFGALGFLLIFLIYQLVYVPLMKTRDAYSREKLELESMLGSYEHLAERYVQLKSTYTEQASRLERKKSLSVLTYLENEAQQAGVRSNIEYIRPQGTTLRESVRASTVEMKINAIANRDLLEFLARIERNREGLLITYLRLKPFYREKEKIDVIVRVSDIVIE
jgi:type II secretory pathway component PulM